MFEEKIILDDSSFKALSSESRVNILKNLNNRRMTLSELSKKLKLENSTIKEHCTNIVNADLIKQIDEVRKWKYYELKNKGKNLIQPNLTEQIKVLVVLCLGAIIFGGILTLILQPEILFGESIYSNPTNIEMLTKSTIAPAMSENNFLIQDTYNDMTINDYGLREETIGQIENTVTKEFFILGITISIIFGIITGWVFAKKY